MKNIINRLFGSFKSQETKTSLTEDQFLQTDEVIQFLKSYHKSTTLLNPKFCEEEISIERSKMGGLPNLRNFEYYPSCKNCNNKLNFVIQIYKKEHPNFYFPIDHDLFQLFRCPNMDCESSFSMKHDLPMYFYYFSDDQNSAQLELPKEQYSSTLESRIPNCILNPKNKADYPNFDDYDEDIDSLISEKYGEQWCDYMVDNLSAKLGTKYNGYPSWTQSPDRPICTCGKEKYFIFQLASEEFKYDKKKDAYSDHGIMIGDLGNIYIFICKECGIDSIESTWDCY